MFSNKITQQLAKQPTNWLFNQRNQFRFSKILSQKVVKPQAWKSQNWKTLSLAAFGLSFSSYMLHNQLINLDQYYEVTIDADFKEGEKRAVQVGPKEGDQVLVTKVDGQYYCVSNSCTHFGFTLNKGQLFDDKVTCPLHMAQFSVKTGEHEYGPTFKGLETFQIVEKDGKLHIKVDKDKLNKGKNLPMSKRGNDPRRFLIVGGGVASLSAAETLRQSGFEGEITILSSEAETPYDRTMLSKFFGAKLEGITIRNEDFLQEFNINLLKNTKVTSVDTRNHFIQTADGKHLHYEKLLIATGATPRIPLVPNSNAKGVHALRNWQDLQQIKESAADAKNIVIVGASFIGLESASSIKEFLKGKDLNITVCDAAKIPYSRVLGPEVGQAIQKLHESNGIKFSLENGIKSIDVGANGKIKSVKLSNGQVIEADMVILGTGVTPNTNFVKNQLKLSKDGGIETDVFHRAIGQADVYAAGDVATYPWWYTGEQVRIEHYNEAINQGYLTALNMLGKQVPNDNIPFFWTRFHNKSLCYTGFAKTYDDIHVDGNLNDSNFLVWYFRNNQVVAAASMGQLNTTMIINEAMKQNVLPKAGDIKTGRVTLKDIEASVRAKGHKCKCRKGGNCKKRAKQFSTQL